MAILSLELTDEDKHLSYCGEINVSKETFSDIEPRGPCNLSMFLRIMHDFEVRMDQEKYNLFRETFSRLYQIECYGRRIEMDTLTGMDIFKFIIGAFMWFLTTLVWSSIICKCKERELKKKKELSMKDVIERSLDSYWVYLLNLFIRLRSDATYRYPHFYTDFDIDELIQKYAKLINKLESNLSHNKIKFHNDIRGINVINRYLSEWNLPFKIEVENMIENEFKDWQYDQYVLKRTNDNSDWLKDLICQFLEFYKDKKMTKEEFFSWSCIYNCMMENYKTGISFKFTDNYKPSTFNINRDLRDSGIPFRITVEKSVKGKYIHRYRTYWVVLKEEEIKDGKLL